MSWNGSGLFVRLYNWVTDAAAGIDIEAARMDGEDDNLAAGINNCLAKDGQNSPTANLPMATYKHTNVGNATARNQYASYAQVQDSSPQYLGVTAGTADALTVNPTPAISSYAAGQAFGIKLHVDVNDGATINISSKGARSIVVGDAPNTVKAGMLLIDQYVVLYYDGTYFRIIGADRPFCSLGDVPKSLVGQAGKVLACNADEDAIEFANNLILGAKATHLWGTDSTTIGNTSAENALELSTDEFDSGDFRDGASYPTRFTIPTGYDGIYRVVVRVNCKSVNGAGGCRMWVRKNGSTDLTGKFSTGGAAEVGGGYMTVSAQLHSYVALVGGDYIEIILQGNLTGYTCAIDNGAGTPAAEASIELVGEVSV